VIFTSAIGNQQSGQKCQSEQSLFW